MKHLILLAEDNEDDHLLVRRAVRDIEDVELKIAVDGSDALRLLLLIAPAVPALIILDVKMPKLDGFEALAAIREKDGMAELPIVMFSSSDEPKDLAEAERCRATEYVLKPVDADKYVATVQRMIKRHVDGEL